MRTIKSAVQKVLSATPFELKRKRKGLPPSTFSTVRLAMEYYFAKEPSGTILQIGAFDGVSGDPLFDFTSRGQVRAILVEPIESSFLKLQKAYEGVRGISFVHAAIAHADGNATFYRVKNAGRWKNKRWVEQLASFDLNHVMKHGVRRDEIEELTVPTLSLPSLLTRFDLESVEFLQVDTEGFDAEVVRMALELPICPALINFENSHISSDAAAGLFKELEQKGYVWIHSTEDTLAIHKRVIEESNDHKAEEHANHVTGADSR